MLQQGKNCDIPTNHFDNIPIKMIGFQSVFITPKPSKNNFNILINRVLLILFN